MASLISKASLLMVPSVYEDGTLYNVLPSGNKAPDETGNHNGYDQTRADFTFSRGSNLAATRVNSDGLIEKGRENLFTQSNNFNHSDWNVKSGTFTQGVADPDGGNNAWSWTATNTDPYLYQSGKSTSGVSVLSIWVKGVGSTIGKYFEFRIGGTPYYNFVLTGEWQRLEYYVNHSSGGSSVGWEYGNPAVVGDVVHIYQAQYEVGTIATAYMDSGSTTAQAGILEDMPRINYDANGENGALLLEPSRTNSAIHSEYFVSGGWANQGVSITSNSATSPEGVKNATLLKGTVASSRHNIRLNSESSSDSVLSVFAKQKELRYIQIGSANTTNQYVNFDLADGSIGNIGSDFSNAKVEDYGSGWYRLSVVSDDQNNDFYISLVSSKTAGWLETWTPSSADDGLYIYGAQHESGASYASSYIPTHGAAVTRGADSCTGGGDSDSINSTEGVYYLEISALENDGTFRQTSLSNGTNDNRLTIDWTSTDNQIRCYIETQDVSQGSMTASVSDATDYHKIAVKYKANDFALWVDGSEQATNTSAAVPLNINQVRFDNSTGSNSFVGNVKQLAVFDEALSDSELATLTTL